MSYYRTISSSGFSEKNYSYSAYKSYKMVTFGNRQLENKYNPSNLLKNHYNGLKVNEKKSNRSAWLSKATLEEMECKDINGNILKRKIKPDKVALVIEMNMDHDSSLNRGKSRSRNKQNTVNTQRTLLPQSDVLC
jgi:hypothetical protein